MPITDLNFPLLRQVRDRVLADPAHFTMDHWFCTKDIERDVFVEAAKRAHDAGKIPDTEDPYEVFAANFESPTEPSAVLYLPDYVLDELPKDAAPDEGWCGTTACLAGHAVLAHHKISPTDLRRTAKELWSVHPTSDYSRAGAAAMQLPDQGFGSRLLFVKDDWPWRYMEENFDADFDFDDEAVVAARIIDALIEGELRFCRNPDGFVFWGSGNEGYDCFTQQEIEDMSVLGAEVMVSPRAWLEEPQAAPPVAAKVIGVEKDVLVLRVDPQRHTMDDEPDDVPWSERRNFAWEGPMRFMRNGQSFISAIGFSIIRPQHYPSGGTVNWSIVFTNDIAYAIVPPGGDLESVKRDARRALNHRYGEGRAAGIIVHVKEAPIQGCEVIAAKHMPLVDPCLPTEDEKAQRRGEVG